MQAPAQHILEHSISSANIYEYTPQPRDKKVYLPDCALSAHDVSVSALARLEGDLPETDGAGEQLRHLEQGLGKVEVGVVVLGPPQGQLQRLRRQADDLEHAV